MQVTIPEELMRKLSKQNMRDKRVAITSVNWETFDAICTNPSCRHVTNAYGNYVTNLEKRIAELEAQMPRWIPVSERLPKDANTLVLVFSGGRYGIDTYNREAWVFSRTTHWQPMPKA
ncbi:DUF551 domain-containing protein, partial [Arthrospira platensis SPKY1]|nr:DUF551 domain-containing protein [Arthrospira platensis SPKY1]